jgi:hypothetical protein
MSNVDFDTLTRFAIKVNQGNRERAERNRSLCSPLMWLQEYCTVRVDVGRGVGKTDSIARYLTDKDVVLVFNRNMKNIIQNRLNNGKEMRNVIDVKTFSPYNMGLSSPEYIFVDEPSLVFNSVRYEDIMRFFVDDKKYQTVVMLGR